MKVFLSVLTAAILAVGSAFAADDTNTRLISKYLDLAEELAVARVQDQVCDTGAYQSVILDLLEGAQNIPGFDPAKIGSTTRQELKETLRFKAVTGEFTPWDSTLTKEQWTKLLEGTSFNSQPMGVYGSLRHIELLPNGKLKQSSVEVLDEAPWTKTVISHGTWSVQVKKEFVSEGYRALIRVALTLPGKDGKAKTIVLRLSQSDYDHKSWILHTKPAEDEHRGHYNNIRFYNEIVDECEA